ncbi:MAG: F0F1 ATP synthase subunit B [Gemmatimonadaceae bacterium]|nr:F0F1 ATP synthase subunit B [Gemmatimonadaceae bacterium]
MRALLRSTVLLALVTTPALASGGGAEGGKVNLLSPSGGVMFWTLLIFVALFLLLRKFAFGPILAAVESREQALRDALAAAQADRDAAAKLIAEHKAALEGARTEAQALIAEGRATSEKMRAELLGQTKAQQSEMLDRARREIETEKAKAIAELRREAIDLAIAGAGKVIGKNLDDATNRKLVEDYLASLGSR